MIRFDRFLYQKEKSPWVKVLLFPVFLFSLLYGGVVRARLLFYSFGLLKSKHISCPVVSVGNITLGGTGKTPLVMTLARGLLERGILTAILSRGYRREKTSGTIVTDGKSLFLTPEESGDEPNLMARNLKGIPVLVGRNRFISGQIALQRFGVRGLLLDDGYQHLQLHRDLDILLIDSETGFGNLHLFPRGILREPLSHLRRADLFLLTKARQSEADEALEARLRQLYPSTPIFHSHYEPLALIGPKGEWEDLESLKGKKVLAFSGVANPDYFSYLLRKFGIEIVKEMIFPDHHLYSAKDMAVIEEKSRGMDRVVTTEKDMLKLGNLDSADPPLRALRIKAKIWEEEKFYKKVLEIF
jgi:tetraacyldisaccharide 4'-kinase